MSRAKFDMLTENDSAEYSENELDKLIPQYAQNKSELDSYKKICDTENAKIKELMLADNIDKKVCGDYKATLSITKRESFNEDQLLNYINTVIWGDKGSMTCPYTKIQYVIDWDALEKAIYNGDITPEQVMEMDKFKEVKEIPVLKVSRVKKENK